MARAMKDSGIEWIGEIPKEWEVLPTKRIFNHVKRIVGKNAEQYDRLSLTMNGVVKREKTDAEGLQPADFETYQILLKNELVFKLIDLENIATSRVGYSPYNGIVSSAYIVMSNPNQNNMFYYYYFVSLYYRNIFNTMGQGVRSTLSAKDLINKPFILPPLQEQQAIVDFLDHKCDLIDSTIGKQKVVIENLKLYKQSVITETVTKGLDPTAKMKPSGIEWIGDIPEKWDVRKLKYLFAIKKEIAGEEGYDILSVTQNGIKIKDISKNEGQISQDYSKYQLVEIHDFVMNHMDLLTGFVDCSKLRGVTSPDYRVFLLNDTSLNSKVYYTYLFQTCYKNKIFYGLGQGVSGLGRWRLQTDKFLNFEIPVPIPTEQQAIADFLDKKCTEIDNLINGKQKLIEKLSHYKKSLIYECVTGKKEVI